MPTVPTSSSSTLAGFAGDWHGQTGWSRKCLTELAEHGVQTIYHVGDFGLWPGNSGKWFLDQLHKTAHTHDQTLYVTLGNHDDYDRVQFFRTDDLGWQYLKNYPRFRFAPRGHTWTHGGPDNPAGARMASLGGAGSIDKNLRTEGIDWWAAEEIIPADVTALTTNTADRSWDRVDVLITHDAPTGLARRGFPTYPAWATLDVQQYCHEQRVRLRHGVDQVMPRTLIHGHWHEFHHDTLTGVSPAGADYTTDVWSLDRDGKTRNLITGHLHLDVGLTDVVVLRPELQPEPSYR
jgi:hypothetical protein